MSAHKAASTGQSTRQHWRDRFHLRIPTWGLTLGAVAILAAMIPLILLFNHRGAQVQASSDAASAHATKIAQNAVPLASGVQGLCSGNGAVAAQLNVSGLCSAANRVQIAVSGPTGPTGKPGPGPSQAQINDAVDAYFVTHPLPPGQLPPVSQVAALVASYLVANPPAAGQNATPTMVATAVGSYCANGACKGASGDAGPGASDAQVAAQVKVYCSGSGNPCVGATGATGPQGPQGETGRAGPACPEGYSPTNAVIEEPTSGVLGPSTTPVPGVACVTVPPTS